MKLLNLLSVLAIVVAAVEAGNPEYLRGSDSYSVSDTKQYDFSDATQAEPSVTNSCPKKCHLDYEPVKDKDGVVHYNKCIQRLLGCPNNTGLSASDFSKLRRIFDSIDGTIEFDGSGSAQDAVVTVNSAEVRDGIAKNASTNPKSFTEQLLASMLNEISSRKEQKA
ncbi:hypothetical protein F441_06008 [Phytophthora nicotianae CJ01A1]|uniref:Kazal-like domain-containing protein n=5 Tax=Phytophthora nicotianae TaxID=4792 RepID=W2R9M2_PHYN3|nr:hypothetical protein PPTG_02154 [Phytophthora nicotianae INRA-310]ETK90366.1 hypothetical protein L915_05873 [Phytophthora nicotianae]ETO79229.1 hypothetical protein F444_06048 [Phytophthora nicotianae P1976]ETP20280.1 hypothetical protein F441_06008 [Phytophthora nicotianae CJ01A1]KUF68289.1 hypothetical protein AM587_10012067 [Phytophthora nicotianae]ETL96941.1 hypothetical protein L917_05701 [Phytophthora nicotianae]